MKKIFLTGILFLLPSLSYAQIISPGGTVPTAGLFNSLAFSVANQDGCIEYGAGPFASLPTNALRIDCGTTTAQSLSVVGTDTGTAGTSYIMIFHPPVATGDTGIISVNSGDGTDNLSLKINALGQGQVSLADTGAGILIVSGSSVPNGATGTNIRSNSMYGFSNTVSGPETDTIVAGFQYEGSALVKLTNGTTGMGTLDVLGLKASGTAGASCTLTTVSHLTVVNGIVTLCN